MFIRKVSLRHVRLSSQKARLVVDLIRGQYVDNALRILQFTPKKGAPLVSKLLKSAVASARDVGGVDLDALKVSEAWVDMGRTIKRFMPRAQGRATPILKRSAHINLVVRDS